MCFVALFDSHGTKRAIAGVSAFRFWRFSSRALVLYAGAFRSAAGLAAAHAVLEDAARMGGKYAYGIYVYHPVVFYFRASFAATWERPWFSYLSGVAVCLLCLRRREG